MKKILFMIHDLGHGGAEKVLVNLVNNMNQSKFDITLIALFGGGVNERFLKPHIHYRSVVPKAFRGNIHLMKLLTPALLHKWLVKERYDIEISYLEDTSARIISGCPNLDTKLVSWVHSTMRSMWDVAWAFRSQREALDCYNRFDRNVFVSAGVQRAFLEYCPIDGVCQVLYNTNETGKIVEAAREPVQEAVFGWDVFRLCGVGKLTQNKGFDRLLRVHRRLREEGYAVHTCILGDGEGKAELTSYISENGLEENVSLLGYQTNPYKYVSKCDLFVCASHAEGFSTAATEALIVGTPVCTVEVSGMKEMLGENNEWGVVTENNEEALYQGIKKLLDDPALLAHYKKMAIERGKTFSTENTVKAVEDMLLSL